MAVQYVGSTKWSAVTIWAALTAYSVGDRRRQTANLGTLTVGNERVFRCTTAGTSGAAEPTWTLTAGATTNDGSAVWTEVTGLSTHNSGGTWGAPHARFENAFASGWMAAGDEMRVSHAHAGTRITLVTLASPGTAAAPCRIVCVNDGDTARATSATFVTTSGAITFTGFCHSYGVIYQAGTASSPALLFTSTSAWHWIIEAGALKLTVTSGANHITVGQISGTSAGQLLELIDSDLSFGFTGSTIALNGQFTMRGGSLLANTIPTTLITVGTFSGHAELVGVDLSAAGSGKNLVSLSTGFQRVRLLDCKLGSSVAIATGTPAGVGGGTVEVVNCDSADTNYRFHGQDYTATETQETTIVRSGGASDGTTTVSRKIVTTANAKAQAPYRSLPIEFWNEVIGSAITVTIPVITDNVTLTDADAWLEIEHLGTSGFPLGVMASDRVADLTFDSPANQTTDGVSSWTTTGLSTPIQQSLAVTFTPQEKGIVRARVVLAKASETMYYDPLPQVT